METSKPIVGEIRAFSSDELPQEWLSCDGRILPIKGNEALFGVIGTQYGGNGRTTFALPDLRGRVPLHKGNSIEVGAVGGEERHSLTAGEMAIHTHPAFGTIDPADQSTATNNFWASDSGQKPFSDNANQMMSSTAISKIGSANGHENMSPYLALNFAIATTGVLNSRDGMLGEIIMFAGTYIDNESEWAFCDGKLLSIAQNTALFSICAATYGGNGYSTFALPDLQGRAPMQCGQGNGLSNRELGEPGGSATVTLTEDQLPQHKHEAVATTAAALTSNPYNSIWATGGQTRGGVPFYASGGIHTAMNPDALVKAGGGKPHNNMPPYLGINFLICLQGDYPHRPTS